MSKLGYKAAATGAGTITLETPVTDVDRTILLPDAGGQMHTSESVNDHASMPTVAGVPIVESGSNTDGEWTRWADGTQQCQSVDLVTSTSADTTWTFPVPFVSAPKAPIGAARTSSNNINVHCRAGGSATVVNYAGFTAATEARAAAGASLFVAGRWK